MPSKLWRWLMDWRSHLKTLSLVLLLALAVNAWQSRHVPTGRAPSLDAVLLPQAGQQDASLQAWLEQRRGQVVAVHFWATWCPICKASEDNITRLMGDWPIVTVAMQSGNEMAVQHHLHKAALPWPTVLDPNGSLAETWGVRAVPATVILDSKGRVATASMGYTSTLGLWARLWWLRVFGA